MARDQSDAWRSPATSIGASRRLGAWSGPSTHVTDPGRGSSAYCTSPVTTPVVFTARCRRASTSPPFESSIRPSAARTRSSRSDASARASAISGSRRPFSRRPTCGARERARSRPLASTWSTRSGASRIARTDRARLANRDAPSSIPKVAEIVSSSWWASSITTTSCSGRITPPDSRCSPYRCVLTTTTDASAAARRACSAKHTSPLGQRAAPGHSLDETLTAAHAVGDGSKLSSARSPVGDSSLHARMRRSSSSGARAASPSSASWSAPWPTSATRWRQT